VPTASKQFATQQRCGHASPGWSLQLRVNTALKLWRHVLVPLC